MKSLKMTGWALAIAALALQTTAEAVPIVWKTTRAQAVAAAQASGKKILLMAGRESCGHCQNMKYTVCELPDIRPIIDANYVGWFCVVDTSTEWQAYASGLGSFTTPLICVIDPSDPLNYLDRTTSSQDAAVFKARLLSHVSAPGVDRYEPDNTKGTAKKISNGQTQNRSLLPEGDVDWAKFTVNSYGAANVRISTTGTEGDTQLSVWRGLLGEQVAFNDDYGGTSFSRVSIPNLAPGTYYIKVQGYNNVPSPAYALKAAWNPGDAYEKDNVSGSAKEIANGETQARNIHAAGNKDWAKFTIGVAGATGVRLATAGASGDTQMWLYRQNGAGTGAGTQIAYNDNGGVGDFSRIKRTSLPEGTYYIKITENGNNGKIAAYTLKATWTCGGCTQHIP